MDSGAGGRRESPSHRRPRSFSRSFVRSLGLVAAATTPREPAHRSDTPEPFARRTGRRAAPLRASGHMRHDPTAGREHGAGTNGNVVGNPDLAADDDEIPDRDAARD